MSEDAYPLLPVAMRVTEISKRDFDALCSAASTSSSVVERLKSQRGPANFDFLREIFEASFRQNREGYEYLARDGKD